MPFAEDQHPCGLLGGIFTAVTPALARIASKASVRPFSCTRFDMAAFAGAARDLGVNYIGVCCGGAPHQVRAMAEALGREVPASKYAPAMELHPILGAAGVAAEANVLAAWNVAG